MKVKSVNDCNESSWSDPFDISVIANPVVNLGPDTTITFTDTLELDAGNPGASYLWSTGATSQTINAFYTGNPATTFWVEVTTDSCTDNDTVVISFTDPVFITGREHGIRIRIIPNPNDGHFVVEITSENPVNCLLEIIDMTGRVVVEQQELSISRMVSIDISIPRAQDGVYLLRLLSEKYLLVEKVLVF